MVACALLLLCGIALVAATEKCPDIVTREEWGAAKPKKETSLTIPVEYIFIHHTATPGCSSESACARRLRSIQNYHMKERHWDDIAYSFLVGGDGKIYEGRGWGKAGAHTTNYNRRSYAVTFIGNYQEDVPTETQLSTVKQLLQCGVQLGEIKENYKLLGHRQVKATDCPGDNLYNEIRKWDHWVEKP